MKLSITIERLMLTVAFVLVVLITLSLSGCAAMETTTLVVNPDGSIIVPQE